MMRKGDTAKVKDFYVTVVTSGHQIFLTIMRNTVNSAQISLKITVISKIIEIIIIER